MQEAIININLYAPNITPPKYMQQLANFYRIEVASSTIVVGDFHTPLSVMERIRETEDQ